MEMTYERWQKKTLRHSFSSIGWILLIYYGIMNLSVFLAVFIETLAGMRSVRGMEDLMLLVERAAGNAWGYFLAILIGLVILLLWKKPRFWKNEIWAKGKPMKPGSFFSILSIFISGQMIYQIMVVLTELVLNIFGLSIVDGLDSMAVDSGNFTMFLYSGILAPIAEEILFRGLIQKTLMPYGKKFAILCSAFAFGIFHGSLLQSPYAFLVGLVLGYVAAEYSIAWAMALHMVNNLVIADMLTRLTIGMSELGAALLVWVIIAGFTVAAIVVVIVKRREIAAYLHQERLNGLFTKCFFSCPGMIILMILMGLSMIVTGFLMIGPL